MNGEHDVSDWEVVRYETIGRNPKSTPLPPAPAPDRRERSVPVSTTLVVAWQNPETRLISAVGLLGQEAEHYRFRYLASAERVQGFAPFIGFPDLRAEYVSPRLFGLFRQRVMSPRRPDYAAYLSRLDLSPEDATPWEQLTRSEGRRTGDTVQLLPVPQVEDDGRTSCLFLVHGIRHVFGNDALPLAVGDRLELVDEPTNRTDPRAVLVATATGQRIGYVPDLLLDYLGTVRRSGPLDLAVEHVNGPDAPPHLRLLARLDGTVPPGYRPMAGSGWETFGEG